MTGRAGVRIAVALSSATWLGAVAVAGLFLDMPLRAPVPGGVCPMLAPAVEQEAPKPPPERKAKEKIIEIAPWEEVPA
jgi:hypothetical protein